MIGSIPTDCPPLLRQFLEQQIRALEINISNASKLDILTSLPTKPVEGKVYYFGNTIGTTITAKGYWGYKGGGTWALLG